MNRAKQPNTSRRAIPSVDRVVRELMTPDLPRAVIVRVARRELAKLRASADVAGNGHIPNVPDIIAQIRSVIEELRCARIQPIINATGILIHTNFGRSPMGEAAVAALSTAASSYTNLEYDLGRGERGKRGSYVEHNLAILCGAEAATVVNNCAAALVLILRQFAATAPRNEVIISRGEMVQIGGGFRIPEILESSGAKLREVGTTNQTTVDDYRRAICPQTAMILKVHHSNFFMEGFVASPTIEQISMIARQADVPLLHDLGSGATFDTTCLGQEREPMPREMLADGADLVCFSGDKLLGGPQAGIIAGSGTHIAALKRNPFYRALRCDKLILAALETTVDLLLSDRLHDVPIRVMMQIDPNDLEQRARNILSAISDVPVLADIGEGHAQVGGGSLPRTMIPSVTINIRPRAASMNVQDVATLLRLGRPPIVAYIEKDCLKLDLRTVFAHQDQPLAIAIRAAVERTVVKI
jgi:L-seryl-tRNA(Ser) seleniumtransferase